MDTAESSDSEEFRRVTTEGLEVEPVRVVSSENQKTIMKDPVTHESDLSIEWEALKIRQIQRGVDHLEVDKAWKSILSRHRNLGRQWDMLERMVPGYVVPSIP